jgi:hypothetical protein
MRDLSLSAPGLSLGALEASTAAAARTAVTGFVGVAERGPLHQPQTLRSFGEFLEVFGGFWEFGCLAESVYAFFLNGGEEACVVRVGGPLPTPAVPPTSCVLQEALTAAQNLDPIGDDKTGAETLRLRAKNEGAWGNRLRARFFAEASLEMDLGRLTALAPAGVSPAGTSQVEVDFIYDYRIGGKVWLTHRENSFARSEHEVTDIDEASRRLTLMPPLPRAYPEGSLVRARGFRLEVTDGTRREVFDRLSMNPSHPRYFVDIINGVPGEPYLEGARAGHSLLVSAERVLGPDAAPRFKPADSSYVISFAGGGDGVTFARGQLGDAESSPVLRAVALVKGRAGNGIRLRAEPFKGRLALPVPAVPGGGQKRLVLEDIRGWSAGDRITLTHASDGTKSETHTIQEVFLERHEVLLASGLAHGYPMGSQVTMADRFNLFVDSPSGPELSESFFNLSMQAEQARFFKTVVNAGSLLVSVDTVSSAGTRPTGVTQLAHGADPEELPLVHVLGYAEDGSLTRLGSDPAPLGVAALESVPDVNLLCVPDLVYRQDLSSEDVILSQRRVLAHCEKMGDRFALLDVPRGRTPEQAFEWPAHFSDGKFSRFGALYYPWISMAIAGADQWLPPSGAVASLIAQADRREGVGRAPANLTFKGVVGLERELEAAEQGELNLRGVNCIRKFEAGAIRLWGARTLSGEEEHLYVHNRRVVLLAIKALSRSLRWAVFEPNDARLRRQIKDSIEGFLRGLLAQGLTAGNRPEDAFYVKVDEAPDGSDMSDAGQVLAEVGIALSRPAEFIALTVKRRPEILTLVEEEA